MAAYRGCVHPRVYLDVMYNPAVDSVTEADFESMACMLFPHVRAAPEAPYLDRVMQTLYLNPDSPLVPSLTFPDGFSIADTPLVAFRRRRLLDPAEYMPMFTAPLPHANYKTMVVSRHSGSRSVANSVPGEH